MAVSFNSIPSNINIPLYWIEFDSSQAGFPKSRNPILLTGIKLAAGVAPANVPIAVASQQDAANQFGSGSMLERMFVACQNNNALQETWCLPIAEPSAGVAATGSITINVTTVSNVSKVLDGTYTLYIAGQKMQIRIYAGSSAATIATSVSQTINSITSLPVTAAIDGTNANQVNLTCKWKGITGNTIFTTDTLGGYNAGEQSPLSIGLGPNYSGSGFLASGTGTPDFSAAIANIGDADYEYVGLPFTDSSSLDAWQIEYGFTDSGRRGYLRQSFGHVFTARRSGYSDLMTFGPTRNTGVISILALETLTPSTDWEAAAIYAAVAAKSLTNDPARPLQTLEFNQFMPPARPARFSTAQLNSLAANGLAVQRVGSSGNIQIMRESTTYQRNAYGVSDDAYDLVTTLATLAAITRRQRAAITNKFQRHKLANDGTRLGAGQAIVTPLIIKSELVAEYRAAELDGLVENTDEFKKYLIVERDSNNPNRVNVLYPPDLINQLRIFAVLNQFRLQYGRGTVDLAA